MNANINVNSIPSITHELGDLGDLGDLLGERLQIKLLLLVGNVPKPQTMRSVYRKALHARHKMRMSTINCECFMIVHLM